jgi:hypothetical protein
MAEIFLRNLRGIRPDISRPSARSHNATLRIENGFHSVTNHKNIICICPFGYIYLYASKENFLIRKVAFLVDFYITHNLEHSKKLKVKLSL